MKNLGDRAQVLIKDTGVYLYTHWGGSGLPKVVAEALNSDVGRNRWTDPEYLARIIFDRMVGDHRGGELGYGIDTSKHGDVYRVIEVDCEMGKVRTIIDDVEEECSFEDFIKNPSW